MKIPLHNPSIGETEVSNVVSVLESAEIKGGGKFDSECARFLEDRFGTARAMMTTSCTHSLEMAAILMDIGPQDTVVVPSYTFTSTATAFALHGANIEFCDVDPDSLNMDPDSLRETITEDTAAVVPVHYGGVACEMDEITAIADDHDALVVEDAAQALNASYKGEPLGTVGDIGCFSFHGTKSYVAGEGGAIFLNDESFIDRAEKIRQKGTNYEAFRRGEVDRYTWVDAGSSYVPSELQTALLRAQLERIDEITSVQKGVHDRYVSELKPLEREGLLELPTIPAHADPNYHLFPVLARTESEREALVTHLREEGVEAASHYEPLHTSPYGREYGYQKGDLPETESVSKRLLRLPIHTAVSDTDVDAIGESIYEFYESATPELEGPTDGID
ncbi:dTDP-4-amino-4,6-dideoxygalactose transaminase [Halobacterium jilantaiense]|uniref:dTDP-4-amino-4,6-dideoxygalactose transaminase n=1 Tax=Halobacterium jilantaiense TaxID=355548 RepID=A0A1I0MTC6_9EURY|nr:dTDP-4-amino-4,6-dideoxygalactose transaminase [Halobacterium jilantaiense]SEV91704.1 dTDP-4-amino-4,6-dideoxygalactose transaminase [Halobacterium jilantaiense]